MLSQKATKELKEIVLNENGVSISDDQAVELGMSLLRLTRVGLSVLARANAKVAFVQAREENSLVANTSVQ
ncbi:MAG: hypothetical protein RLZZ347_202 [Candidatus Parcubacteria bacterium]|jgi:hypothetical protein